jgi:ABC-2 type transport system ATP-binding protein
VIFSTHQMSQVEELCDRVLMLNKGQEVLYGDLLEIKSRYRSNTVLLDFEGKLGEVPGVVEQRPQKGYVELVLDKNTTPQQLLHILTATGVTINRFEVATPSLNEIFLKVVGKNNE